MESGRSWWKNAIIYQIYPKSFRDASGDGVGDLAGIIEKLDHIADLGATLVWLSPIFASPMIDNGYDIADFYAVNPLFGDMADAERLIEEAKARGLKIILDITPNHTSTAHPWFKDVLDGGPKQDWYIVREGRGDDPPNNWLSTFGGPAWSRLPDGRWYLHLFDRTQADLNWENPEVRAALHEAMRFWLQKGIGGFRLDVITLISKPPLDDLPDPTHHGVFRACADGPRLHDFLREMRRDVFDRYDCVAIGEAVGVNAQRGARLVDPADPMLDVIYHFDLVYPPRDASGAWDRIAFKRVFAEWDEAVGARGWNTIVLSNHDLGRLVSRFGDDAAYWRESATMLLALVLLQRGTPFIYQGDELAMTNAPFQSIEELDDVWAKTTYRLALEAGNSEAEAFAQALAITRDHARTPMLWDAAPGVGFSDAEPWLRALDPVGGRDAASQRADPLSVLSFARALTRLRAADSVWTHGAYADLAPDHPDLFVFARAFEGRRGVVALNLRGVSVEAIDACPATAPTLGNLGGRTGAFAPFEARIWML